MLRDKINENLSKYASVGAVIDSNLLLLFFVGSCDESRISRFKRTKTFTKEDFRLLARFIQQFSVIRTTPYILTEVNSLLNQLDEKLKPDFFSKFTELMPQLEENHINSQSLSEMESFNKYGLTDTAITEEAKQNGMLVLTDDLRLSGYLSKVGIDVINFNNIRCLNWA